MPTPIQPHASRNAPHDLLTTGAERHTDAGPARSPRDRKCDDRIETDDGLQQVIGNFLDTLRDRAAAHRFERDRAHDQQVEPALQDVGLMLTMLPSSRNDEQQFNGAS